MISSEALSAFKRIWVDEFGEDISDEMATVEAINLLVAFDATYRPIKQEWVDEYENAKKVIETRPSSAMS